MPEPAKTPPVPHVRIPKALYDDLLRARFTANQAKVVLCVVRFTFGHRNKPAGARISRRFIAERTNLHERTVRSVANGLREQGVLVEAQPAAGRQPAVIALQQDASRWGIHAPDAPPLPHSQGNPDKLSPYRFGETLCARARADKLSDLSARGTAPLAGEGARTDCGRARADSEELEVISLKTQDDDGALTEPPSPCAQERPRSFILPGYGLVYEHDTWALHQPDSRPLYLATFGASNNGGKA